MKRSIVFWILLVMVFLVGQVMNQACAEGLPISAVGGDELITSCSTGQVLWVWSLWDNGCLKKGNVRAEYYVNFDEEIYAYFDLISCEEVQLPNFGYLKLIPVLDGKQYVMVDLSKMSKNFSIFISKADNHITISNCPQYGILYSKIITLIPIEDKNWQYHNTDYLKNVNYPAF